MAEDRRHDAEEAPAEAATAPAESPAPSPSVAVAQVPETSAETPVETHTQAQIDLDNLRERDEVLPMESVPPADQQSDMPADLQELRQATSRPQRPPVVDNERRYGPLSGSMWFLVIAIFAFVLTLIFRLLG
jgi:hypothetical protein